MKQTSDTTFAPDWISLREPADHGARDADLLARAAACVGARGGVLDLGGGTGSTIRAFSKAGHVTLCWRVFDNDPTLLELAQANHPAAECLLGDIMDIAGVPFDGIDLITASALFDLMPEAWLRALLERAERSGLPVYAALNYDGHMGWTPTKARDARITQAFNAHQLGDKGAGPAMGPTSGSKFAQLARARGWEVVMADSPWQLGPQHAALHDKLLEGIADAAQEAGASDAQDWFRYRRTALSETSATIGHVDVLAIPPGSFAMRRAQIGETDGQS